MKWDDTTIEAQEKSKFNAIAMRESYDPDGLRIEERHWRKLDDPIPPSNSYIHSIKSLGNIMGKVVLDFGCGTGGLSVILAKCGGRIVAFDISFQSVLRAKMRAKANDVEENILLFVASAHALPLKDGCLNLIIGQAILHHLCLEAASNEVLRILQPGGKAIFQEACANSRALQMIRKAIPVKCDDDTDSPRAQLSHDDIALLTAKFSKCCTAEFQILSRLDRVTQNRLLLALLHRVDAFLLQEVPFMKRFARYIVIEVRK